MASATHTVYLRSPHWQRVRRAYFKDHLRRCFVCERSPRNLSLHHRHYQTLGCETWEDLVALCVSCHNLLHADPRWHADSHIDLRQRYLTGGPAALTQLRRTRRAQRTARSSAPPSSFRRSFEKQRLKDFYGCPTCGASPGDSCRTGEGRKRKPHTSRYLDAYAAQGKPRRTRKRRPGAPVRVISVGELTEAAQSRYALTPSPSRESVSDYLAPRVQPTHRERITVGS